MAGASMNDIKSRIKSVSGTMQITKAMELVATSKLRRAKERAERCRPFRAVMNEAVLSLISSPEIKATVWGEGRGEKALYIVIAGDRGLAGGYNANIFRLTKALSEGKTVQILPIGKKALEYFKNRKSDILSEDYSAVGAIGVGEAFSIAETVASAFMRGEYSEVKLIYTSFKSMISTVPTVEDVLPLSKTETGASEATEPEFECLEVEEMLSAIIPEYVGGLIYSAVCDALASESASRRNAMNSANKNAEEMIGELVLKYNRARQSVITQEITEIVSGAEAL